MNELEIMIILIEGHYSRTKRNRPELMTQLIKKEFGVVIDPNEILKSCGLVEDYEQLSKNIENE